MTLEDIIQKRDRLFDTLINLAYDDDGWILSADLVPQEAKQAAYDLASCITGTENDQYQAHRWMLIYEALGDIENARQIGDRELKRIFTEIQAGEYAEYPQLLVEEIETIQFLAEFQAQRLWILGMREEALDCIKEAIDLASQFNVPLSDDLLDLRDDLLERICT